MNFDPDALRLAIEFAGADQHPGRQRLSAPDRQHPEDVVQYPIARAPDRRRSEDSGRKRGPAACGVTGGTAQRRKDAKTQSELVFTQAFLSPLRRSVNASLRQ